MNGGDQSYRQAWQAAPLAILTLDVRGQVESFNPACERMFMRSQDLLRGVPLDSLSHALDRGALRQMLGEALAGRVPPRQEIRFLRPGGEVTTGFSVAPTRDGDGHLVCIVRDLSHEQAFRPQLLHTERMASIGTVASVVAHELNNALTGAFGCLQLLPRQTEPGAQELVDEMGSELQRAAEIIKELKSYARVEDGLGDRIDLGALMVRLQRLQRYHQDGAGTACRIELELDDAMPELVGNANQLLQALLNLVRNAEHAMAGVPEARRVIGVRARAHGDVVVLEVVDHGPGVPPGLRARLFEPFYSTKPAGEGTGLGLTVVQAVAAGHGGRVEIDQTPGGGATVRMVLPAGSTAAASRPTPSSKREERPRPQLQGARILVADDEPVILRVVERACTRHGALVTCVGGTDDAKQALQQQAYDVALLDIRMPGGGGPEVFRTILDEHPSMATRTVFMSGDISTDMAEIVGLGHAGTLNKPFALDDLLDAIVGVLVGEG